MHLIVPVAATEPNACQHQNVPVVHPFAASLRHGFFIDVTANAISSTVSHLIFAEPFLRLACFSATQTCLRTDTSLHIRNSLEDFFSLNVKRCCSPDSFTEREHPQSAGLQNNRLGIALLHTTNLAAIVLQHCTTEYAIVSRRIRSRNAHGRSPETSS